MWYDIYSPIPHSPFPIPHPIQQREKRHSKHNLHPRTPDPNEDMSKRCFDGHISSWRRALHKWDDSNKIEKIEYSDKREYSLVINPVGVPSPINHKKLKKQVEALTQSAKLSEEAAGTGKEPGSPSYDERLPNEEDQDRSPINSKRLKIAEDEEPLEFEIEEEVEPVDALVGLDAEDDDFL